MTDLPRFRNDARGLPVATARQLDDYAELVIRDFDPAVMRDPHPVDLDALTERYLGFSQDYLTLSCDGSVLGMTVFESSDMIPVYDAIEGRARFAHADADTVIIDADLLRADRGHRCRFTQAHECAHALLHRAYFTGASRHGSGLYACTEQDMREGAAQISEWQANRTASALLMPGASVYRLLDRAGLRGSGSREQMQMLELLCRVYDVSDEAARIRLKTLGYRVSCMTRRQLRLIYDSEFLSPTPIHDNI